MSNVLRLHIRPRGGLADHELSFGFCRERSVLGLGWAAPQSTDVRTWEDYLAAAVPLYGESGVTRVRDLHDGAVKDSLIWTRSPDAKYYLGRVLSPWRYIGDDPAARDADIANVVDVDLRRVADDAVPGGIQAAFRPNRTIQRVAQAPLCEYSKALWNGIEEVSRYAVAQLGAEAFYDLIDDQTAEDVAALWLQTIGWLIVPSSAKRSTMRFEFFMVSPDRSEVGRLQVKTGNVPLDPSDYEEEGYVTFLFQTRGRCLEPTSPNVVRIDPGALLDFALTNRHWLPTSARIWLDRLVSPTEA